MLPKLRSLSIAWLILCIAFVLGMMLRDWTWQHTEPVRWLSDIRNAFYWGSRVNRDVRTGPTSQFDTTGSWQDFWQSYRTIFDREWKTPTPTALIPMDYTPLRVVVVGVWARNLLQDGIPPPPRYFDAEHARLVEEYIGPLLTLNVIFSLACAAAAFLIVRVWMRRARASDCRTTICSGIAAALVWFNPALILDSHGWPQWDVWCAAFFLWAIFCASVDAWFIAGALIVVGAMLKGQILFGSPVLLVWAMFAGGVSPLVRFVVGIFLVTALLTAQWIIPTPAAWAFVAIMLVVVGIMTFSFLKIVERRSGVPIMWTPRLVGYQIAAIVCVAMWSACWLFGGSLAWFHVGFLFPTDHYQVMSHAASSIPAILESRWDWHLNDIVFNDITLRSLLRAIYAGVLILSGLAAAIQARRGSPRVLLAVCAPWVLFYAILPQMQERYLVWAAVFTPICIVAGTNLAMLSLVVTFVAAVDILRKILWIDPNYAPRLYSALGRIEGTSGGIPELGWVVLLAGLAYLYLAWKFDRRTVSITPKESASHASPAIDQTSAATD